MNYLFDTHAFLWSIFNPEKLSPAVQKIFQNRDVSIALSSVTFWEISLKFGMGKLVLTDHLPEDLIKIADKLSFNLLELTPAHAASFHQLPRKIHKDPFDRMIVWQAICEKMTLVSKDGELDSYKGHGLTRFW